ncbi:hypothetical protein [uncultured Algibacter sp.]|mgnify:FL=1|uniref:hypothetical protein n=1 Tax=uncultured Algibacter sp. TaxID=298659 RepID=UPI0030EC6FC1|tara:strand:- start:532 stop:882 length:351 start_codon:yes stop_codon:yes gene_type:complete
MAEKLIEVKEVALKNNCPECFSTNGLRLNFKQKIKETKFYKSITSEISHEITCKTCKSVIYPEQWTDDIDRVFEYQKKAFTPKNSSTYLKKTSWIVIATIVVLVALILLLLFYLNL